MTTTYRPRGDLVVLRREKRTRRGLEMPDRAAEGWATLVVATGPKVEDLAVGDEVMVITAEGAATPIPNETEMYLTRESNVALIVTREE